MPKNRNAEDCPDFEPVRKDITFEDIIKNSLNEQNKAYIPCYTSGILLDDVFFHTIFLEFEGKFYPVIVTSSGKILSVIDNEKELLSSGYLKQEINTDDRFYYFEFNNVKYKIIQPIIFKDIYKINTIDNKVISLIKDKKKPSKKLYDKGKKIIYDYWDHFNQFEYDIVLAFIFLSYLMRAIGKTFYWIMQGKKDTGKSTLQIVISLMQFNGFFGGRGTVALSCRFAHCLGVNINQDEFDKLSKDEKRNFIGMANNGYYADGTYGITNVNKKRIEDQIVIFWTFAQRSFSTNKLYDFDDAFLSRCYICVCVPNNRCVKNIFDLSEKDKQRFQDFRNNCFVYCLFNWKKIKNEIESVKKELEDEGIFGRKTDINSMILGVIKHFKGDYYKKVKQYLMDKENIDQKEKHDTYESIVFDYIANLFFEEKHTVEISNKELVEHICNELGITPENTDKKPHPKTIGSILRNHSLLNKPENINRRGEKGATSYVISRSQFEDMLRRFGYNDILNKMQNLNSFASNSSNASQYFEGNEENEGNEVNSRMLNLAIETMYKHPTRDWHHTEIVKEMGLSDTKAMQLHDVLKKITANPKNNIGIGRGKEEGYYHLTKITWTGESK